MKSRIYSTPFFQNSRSGPWRQKNLLLKVSLLLIFCWTIGSIWLISVRREERRIADVRERQGTIALLFTGEEETSR